ncbi:MAG: hypothetical protein R6V05_11715, partial [Candidatus Brocadiia bacterium]
MEAHLTPRERVRLALEHRETDRVPIAMVCSGFGGDLREELTQHLARERGVSLEDYLRPLIDIQTVGPGYGG